MCVLVVFLFVAFVVLFFHYPCYCLCNEDHIGIAAVFKHYAKALFLNVVDGSHCVCGVCVFVFLCG